MGPGIVSHQAYLYKKRRGDKTDHVLDMVRHGWVWFGIRYSEQKNGHLLYSKVGRPIMSRHKFGRHVHRTLSNHFVLHILAESAS